jgi:hypothetical protein
MDPTTTITAEELSNLTGLTNRRHQQLAADGYFPHPIGKGYLLAPTITGLFKYYREHNQRTKEKLVNTKDDKTQKEIRLLDMKIAREERRTVERAEVNTLLLHVASQQKAVLFAALEREFPGKVVGRTASEISAQGRALADRLCEIFQREVEQWQTHD